MGALFVHSHESALNEFPLDDAWIHQVYARSVWREGRFAYNPGVAETGATSPLWAILLAPSSWLQHSVGLSVVLYAKLLGAVLACAVLWLWCVRLTQMFGARAGWLLLLGSMAFPLFFFSAFSGMEVTLTTLCLSLALVAVIDERFWISGLLIAFTVLSRPDAAVPCAVLIALGAWRVQKTGRLRTFAQLAIPSALLGVVWISLNMMATGWPLPNTFYAKSNAAPMQGLQFVWHQIVVGWSPLRWLLVGPACLVGLHRAWRERVWLLSASATLMIVGVVALVLTVSLSPAVSFYMSRYFVPYTALLLPLVAVGLDRIAERIPKQVGALALVAALLFCIPAQLSAALSYGAHCRDIRDLHTRPFEELARHIENDAVVAVEGAGASRWLLSQRVVDLVGLNDHLRVHLKTGSEQICYIASLHPTYWVAPSDWLARYEPAFELHILSTHSQPNWSVVGGNASRSVTVAAMRPREGLAEFCRGVR